MSEIREPPPPHSDLIESITPVPPEKGLHGDFSVKVEGMEQPVFLINGPFKTLVFYFRLGREAPEKLVTIINDSVTQIEQTTPEALIQTLSTWELRSVDQFREALSHYGIKLPEAPQR